MLSDFLCRLQRALFDLFHRIPMDIRIRDELYQARVDLLASQGAMEYWVTQTQMLSNRVSRLTGLNNVERDRLMAVMKVDDGK